MSYPVVISYNSTNPKEQAFVTKLGHYFTAKGIEPIAGDPNRAEETMRPWLFHAQWLVLVLTPEAIRSLRVQSLVNTAFERVKQGQMQGVLALAFSSNPVEPEDMPHPLWSTIRTYYTGESDEDYQRTFEKVSRTVRVPMYATSSSTNNWASASGYRTSTSSRPLPARSQLASSSKMRLIVSAIAVLLLIIFSVPVLSNFLISNYQATIKAAVVASVTANATGTAQAKGTANVKATATAIATDAQKLYTEDTGKTADFVMDAQDPKQQWDQEPKNPSCVFNKGTYEVTNDMVGQYTPCMEREMRLTNFVYQVQMKIEDGDAGGLIFRSDDRLTMFYRFSLTSQGDYALFVCPPYCTSTLVDPSNPLVKGSVQKPGQSGTLIGQTKILSVIAKNSDIYLYIDRKFVGHANDSTISNSEIGVYAASTKAPTTRVTFSNVEVWKL